MATEKATENGLRPRDRLRASRDFRRVSREGRRASSQSFVVLVAQRAGATGSARVGLTVSRQVGGAVVRNRVKRRLREWFRTSRLRRSGPVDVVVIARRPAVVLETAELRAELEALGVRAATGAVA